jgi:hypothetical protein
MHQLVPHLQKVVVEQSEVDISSHSFRNRGHDFYMPLNLLVDCQLDAGNEKSWSN